MGREALEWPSAAPAEVATSASWPGGITGITETVITTRGPNGRWNAAALGLHRHDAGVTAQTYGRTRTWRNLRADGRGVINLITDPLQFVRAALSVYEPPAPVLPKTAAVVEVTATAGREWMEEATQMTRWELEPVWVSVRRWRLPTYRRGRIAVIDATVAASRLDVPGEDAAALCDELQRCAEIVERTGSRADRAAFAEIDALSGWRDRQG
jgi:hypothetical protein